MSGDDRDPSADPGGVGARLGDDPSTWATLTGDIYRGEIDRMSTWRGRLDQTTNWAVVIVAAILTWAFSGSDRPHYVILIGIFAVTAFLAMEAIRYREYDVWRTRVRTLQEGPFADMYDPGARRGRDWGSTLASQFRDPTFTITFRESLTHRLRRSYLALLLILFAAWIARITVFRPNETWERSAAILGISGRFVTVAVGAFYAVVIALAVLSARGGRFQEVEE
jgi:uncharacterized membrane protein